MNKVVEYIQSRKLHVHLIVLISICAILYVMTTNIEAFDLVVFPDSWKGQKGYARYLSSSLHYELDIQVLSWNDPIEKTFYGVANFLFSIYKNLSKAFVWVYYSIISFNMSVIFKSSVITIFSALKKVFIDDMRGFLTAFLMFGIVQHYARQNFQKLTKTVLVYFVLIGIAGYLVTDAENIYTTTFEIIHEVNGGVTLSVSSYGDEEVDESADPYLEQAGLYFYSIFVEPYYEINGEGILTSVEMDKLITYKIGSTERDQFIKNYNSKYGIFSRNINNSLSKSSNIIIVALVSLGEILVILMIGSYGVLQQLMIILAYTLLPVVIALATIEFFGGLHVLRRYGINVSQEILKYIMVSVLMGMIIIFDLNIASQFENWLIKLVFKVFIYLIIWKYHEQIIRFITNIIGIRSLGYNPMLDTPYMPYMGRNTQSQSQEYPEVVSDPVKTTDDSNKPPQNINDPSSSVDNPSPSNKQMKFARDLEKDVGIINDSDLSEMSRSDLADYISGLKEIKQSKNQDVPKNAQRDQDEQPDDFISLDENPVEVNPVENNTNSEAKADDSANLQSSPEEDTKEHDEALSLNPIESQNEKADEQDVNFKSADTQDKDVMEQNATSRFEDDERTDIGESTSASEIYENDFVEVLDSLDE